MNHALTGVPYGSLLSMSEVEREDILAQRQEEMQRIQDKRNLDQMFRDRTGGTADSVAKAAKSKWASIILYTLDFDDHARTTRTTGSYEGEVAQIGRTQSKA